MRKYIPFLIMGILFSLYLTGCRSGHSLNNANQKHQTSVDSTDEAASEEAPVLTLEKIKERYTKEDLGKYVETYDYKNYILIEYLNPTGYQCFDLYNLKTGDRDVMLLGCNAEVFNFSSGDSIIFKSDGTHQMSGREYFPYYAVFTRVKEITGNETDFHYGKRELYKSISEGVELSGGKNCEMIFDLKVTLMGFEMSFAPQKGKEAEFYAGNIDIPAMKTSYNQNKNQFIIELADTLVNQELLKKQFREQNRYIDSIQIREKGLNSLIIINLKDDARYYTAENSNSEEFPYVRFIFKKSR